MTHRWIMLTGTSPGAGKTTLSEGLTKTLRQRGVNVDLVQEEAIFGRAEFAEAGRGFKTRRWASPEDLILGYERLVAKASRDSATVVFDWSASAMAEDLPWATDQAALNDHIRAVKLTVAPLHPVTLFLDAPVDAAIDRAAVQRGTGWLANWAGRPEALGPDDAESNRARVLAKIENGEMGTDRNRAAFIAAGWPLIDLDAGLAADEVLSRALAVVSGEGLL